MGEMAEAMLEGSCCEGCGEFFDDVIEGAEPPGYPRRCEGCKMEEDDYAQDDAD